MDAWTVYVGTYQAVIRFMKLSKKSVGTFDSVYVLRASVIIGDSVEFVGKNARTR